MNEIGLTTGIPTHFAVGTDSRAVVTSGMYERKVFGEQMYAHMMNQAPTAPRLGLLSEGVVDPATLSSGRTVSPKRIPSRHPVCRIEVPEPEPVVLPESA